VSSYYLLISNPKLWREKPQQLKKFKRIANRLLKKTAEKMRLRGREMLVGVIGGPSWPMLQVHLCVLEHGNGSFFFPSATKYRYYTLHFDVWQNKITLSLPECSPSSIKELSEQMKYVFREVKATMDDADLIGP
jgi:hypothetical protein